MLFFVSWYSVVNLIVNFVEGTQAIYPDWEAAVPSGDCVFAVPRAAEFKRRRLVAGHDDTTVAYAAAVGRDRVMICTDAKPPPSSKSCLAAAAATGTASAAASCPTIHWWT